MGLLTWRFRAKVILGIYVSEKQKFRRNRCLREEYPVWSLLPR
uniref:Uncharacterized protein n=1 Tax=Candidatus Kentrum sp. LPFa TaxID=2126335 RepID=A0A450VWI8_9GAMM|nr:MAG: hypothetical protein BECKLPF1236B_GA0070989_100618 [Candidatus Kentron sp. LPFa]